jgi:CheY-like chemotaxis protein
MKVAPATKGRVLCTEDDADSRELIVVILEAQGYHVTVTRSSAHALAIAKREAFDLIMVDNGMPGLSGQELTRAVRTFNKSSVAVIFTMLAQAARDAQRLFGLFTRKIH